MKSKRGALNLSAPRFLRVLRYGFFRACGLCVNARLNTR